jgi:hypothetical protein
MYAILVTILAILFAGMLFINIYFRVKVFAAYKILVKNKVEFGASHIFSKSKMEQEILPRYPKMRVEIETFVNYLRFSMRMAMLLILLITIFGAILMWYRHE